jgi:DHA3 family macrolide efflux protein-like MFS transporter
MEKNEKVVEEGYRALLKYKNYTLILSLNIISFFGMMMYQVAFFWLAYIMTNSPVTAGLVILASTSPYLIFGLIGGVYADRWSRKTITLWGTFLTIPAVLLVPVLHWFDLLQVWHVGLTAFTIVTIRCFTHPAVRAMIPQTLPESLWPVGNSLFQVSAQIARSIGPAVGGYLIALYSSMLIFVLFSLLLFIGCLILLPVKIAIEKKKKVHVSVFRDIVDTYYFIKPNKPLYLTIILFGVVLTAYTAMERLALPMLSDSVWDMDVQGFGILMAMLGVGSILGALVLGKVKIKSYSTYIYVGWALWGASTIAIGMSSWFMMAVIFAIILGFAESLNDIPMVLMIQKQVPDDKLGKVFSMWSTVAFVGESSSNIFAGAVIAGIGAIYGMAFAGFALILTGIFGYVMIEYVYKYKPLDSPTDVGSSN